MVMKILLTATLILSFLLGKSQIVDKPYEPPYNYDSAKMAVIESIEDSIIKSISIEVEVLGLPCPNCRLVGVHCWIKHGHFVDKKGKRLFKEGVYSHFYIINVIPWNEYLSGARPEED